MNVKLLRRVQRYIRAEPKRLDMGRWLESGLEPGEKYLVSNWAGRSFYASAPKCGTVGCISGWAEFLDRAKRRDYEALDIDGGQCARLFYVTNWPEKFRKRYAKAKRPLSRTNATIARIDHFIATKGAD